jgi:hypothetical protein
MILIGLVLDVTFTAEWSFGRSVAYGLLSILVISLASAAADRRARGRAHRQRSGDGEPQAQD